MIRRDFIERASLAIAALSLPAVGAETAVSKQPIAVFTKGLEKLPFDEFAAKIADLGVGGIEAPIRKGGHVEPKDVAEKLPLFVEALKKKDLQVMIATTDIVTADKEAEAFLRTAAKLGITRYRLGPYFYDLKKPIAPQVADAAAKLKDLAAMNKELGVQGQFQNHRGNNRIGSPLWDLIEALEGIDSAALGIAFDFAHGTVEGANAWELNFRHASSQIVAIYFKDYRANGRQWDACPLGEGMVNPKGGALVKELLPATTPISLHVEYLESEGEARVAKTLEAMKHDLATVRSWLT